MVIGMRIDITLDCVDLEVTAAFWQAALCYERDQCHRGTVRVPVSQLPQLET